MWWGVASSAAHSTFAFGRGRGGANCAVVRKPALDHAVHSTGLVEHVQLFKMKYFRRKKWRTEHVSQQTEIHSTAYGFIRVYVHATPLLCACFCACHKSVDQFRPVRGGETAGMGSPIPCLAAGWCQLRCRFHAVLGSRLWLGAWQQVLQGHEAPLVAISSQE